MKEAASLTLKLCGAIGIVSPVFSFLVDRRINLDPLLLLLFWTKASSKKVWFCLIMMLVFTVMFSVALIEPNAVIFEPFQEFNWLGPFALATIWAIAAAAMNRLRKPA